MSESRFSGDDGPREPWRGAEESAGGARRPWRLPLEMPRPGSSRESKVLGRVVSFVIHALILAAMLLPVMLSPKVRAAIASGAGGAGPAGGGGGSGGVMGPREKLRYVRIAPAAAAPTPTPTVTPPVQPPPKPTPVQPTPQAQPPSTPITPQDAAASAGAEGKGDAAGAGGAGPGSGGGIGSGVGTGIGSANGPGTGGGADSIYPPSPQSLGVPPQPPQNLRKLGQVMIAFDFEVDSTGQVVALKFTETADGGYNKKVREALKQMKFRPAVRRDGTPVRATFHGSWTF